MNLQRIHWFKNPAGSRNTNNLGYIVGNIKDINFGQLSKTTYLTVLINWLTLLYIPLVFLFTLVGLDDCLPVISLVELFISETFFHLLYSRMFLI